MTQVYCLPGGVPGEFAARYFGRPRLANLYGLLSRPVRVASTEDPATRIPPFVERIWMPAYAIRIQAATRKDSNSVWTSVDGWSGQCAIMDCSDQLVEWELDEDCMPPKLEETEAVKAARKGLLRFILSQRGQMNKPDIGAVEEIRLYHFPLWVYYHHRRFGKRLDIKVLDGCTGKSAGAKMRIALINALVAAKKAKTQPA
ncbi:MAG TPA: hypothetical protein PLI09_03650 [Candidatus Hydrogenedentes bacterium]|nr:hypothetical protein [Candidatus Hydrogenedentota bacterium]